MLPRSEAHRVIELHKSFGKGERSHGAAKVRAGPCSGSLSFRGTGPFLDVISPDIPWTEETPGCGADPFVASFFRVSFQDRTLSRSRDPPPERHHLPLPKPGGVRPLKALKTPRRFRLKLPLTMCSRALYVARCSRWQVPQDPSGPRPPFSP